MFFLLRHNESNENAVIIFKIGYFYHMIVCFVTQVICIITYTQLYIKSGNSKICEFGGEIRTVILSERKNVCLKVLELNINPNFHILR